MNWLQHDWFLLFQTIGIIGSLTATTYTLRRDAWSRKISNYLLLISYHRAVWSLTLDKPELNRIRSRDAALAGKELTAEETQFLTFVFLHITCSYEMQKYGAVVPIQKANFDIAEFLGAPLVDTFWQANKKFYNDDVVRFIESCRLLATSPMETCESLSPLESERSQI